MKKKGFSLIELVIAISIMTIIVGVALPAFSSGVRRQKVLRELQELNDIKESVENYFADTSAFPTAINDLLQNDQGLTGWAGPYYSPRLPSHGSGQTSPTVDEWRSPYAVGLSGSSTCTVTSPGPNKALGNQDDITVTVDVTFIRRRQTLDELAIINSAILSYNKVYLSSEPLLPDWNGIQIQLVNKGYLPAGASDLATDGWGSAYVPDPSGVAPVLKVRSTMISGSGQSGSGSSSSGGGSSGGGPSGKGNGKSGGNKK